ncbi:TPA: hypothetical protein KEY66_000773 [Morganella morganii]|nr:hypothetical protein [Morganella morganii]
MKNKEMNIDEMIEFLKDKNVPEFLLNKNEIEANMPMTQEEITEFAEYIVGNKRNIVANRYLTSCMERFGPGINETFAFRHKDIVMDLSERVIERILINEIEQVILDESEDGVFALWRLYTGNELKEKEEGSTWMRDFIDSVLIDVAHRLTAASANQTIH